MAVLSLPAGMEKALRFDVIFFLTRCPFLVYLPALLYNILMVSGSKPGLFKARSEQLGAQKNEGVAMENGAAVGGGMEAGAEAEWWRPWGAR